MSSVPSQKHLDHIFSAVESELEAGSEEGDASKREMKAILEEKELWSSFEELTNEMIVTKSGRRMFPVLKVRVSGLDPNAMYSILLDFVAADRNRWKYVNGEWIPGGKPEPQSPSCVYIHPESPNFGAHWMKATIAFSKVKLSNKMNGGGQILLNSLHKYEPRVHIVKVGGPQKMISSFAFPETKFIAVTAYQNEEITTLKIKHNPFAKAFLDAKERCNSKDILETSDHTHPAGWSWFLPSTSSFCSSMAQSSLSSSPDHSSYCEPYSGLRNHRASPYPSPYSQQNAASPTNYMDTSTGLSMIPVPDSWSGLSLSSPAGVLPTAASTTSQYPSLWSLSSSSSSSSTVTQSGFSPQFLRASSASYPSLTSAIPSPSNSLYYDNSLMEAQTNDSQYDSTIVRLAPTWTTVTQTY
uniref:T-box domain-containing protein n=1 Tax=Sphenodon punctatus TaxID=8508 RepID=A0A8D0HTU2_SPHPU